MPQDLSARFTKSLAHKGKADFRDVFLDEMQAAESSVNLERYCDEGFPDPESIEFELDDVFQEAGVCSVRVSCTFTETVQTGCSDVALGHPAAVKFDVILDLESDTVVFDYVDCASGYDD